MSRREVREGDWVLYKRNNGYWYYYYYNAKGQRVYRSTGSKTKAGAKDKISEFIRFGVREREKKLTLGYFAQGFYDYDKSHFIKAKLARGYSYTRKSAKVNAGFLENHILPAFGNKKLKDITSASVDRWFLELPKKAKISNKTANNVLTAFRQVMEYAVSEGLIEKNPLDKVKNLAKTSKDTKRRVAFTQEQIRLMFSEPWQNRYAEVACRLAAVTGMRMGEIRALRTENIYEDYIDVCESWSDDDGRKCTKSGWGRVVPISYNVHKMLEGIMPRRGLLFTDDGKVPWGQRVFTRQMYAAMEKHGIKAPNGQMLSFHSFRHTFNTRLLANNVSGEKIRAVIGHEDESMTEHYAHLESSDFEQVSLIQDSMFAI